MGLPAVALPRETVELPDGQTLEVRGLSRAEVLRMAQYENDVVEGEIAAIAWATDIPVEDVRTWYETAPFAVVQAMATAITRLSGTDENAGKGSSGD